jgi:acetyl esterase
VSALTAAKAAFLRRYYRFATARAWHGSDVHAEPGALQLPTSAGPVRAHLYRGEAAAERPLIVYFHGGGWVIGDLQTHHPFCTALSAATGCSVVSVDYRLAPEHPYPAALDDCLAVCRWLQLQLADLGPSNGRLLLAGDSAGGNLAAGCALQLATERSASPTGDDNPPAALCGAVLLYPVTDHYSAEPPSYTERATGQALTRKLMVWFWDTYLAGRSVDDPAVAAALPLRSCALHTLPPCLVVTAGHDPLRDEGIAFAERAAAAGAAVTHHHYAEAEHGFACGMGMTADARKVLAQITAWLHNDVLAPIEPGESTSESEQAGT